MSKILINIDFDSIQKSFGKFIREKAEKAHSTIVYRQGQQLVEEDPRTRQKKILKEYSQAVK